MIQLTDEEINPFVEALQEEAKVDIDGLLKAQLKKVGEWMGKEYPPMSEQHPAIVEFLYKFRQALLEEVKE